MKEILKEGKKDRNRVEFGLEDRVWSLLQMYYIKREAWFSGAKLNGVNCRRLMDQNEEIINRIGDIFIKTNKGTVSEDNIKMYCDKHQYFFIESSHAYRCKRTLKITDELISNTKHVYKTMLL